MKENIRVIISQSECLKEEITWKMAKIATNLYYKKIHRSLANEARLTGVLTN